MFVPGEKFSLEPGAFVFLIFLMNLFQAGDSHQRGEVREGRGFKQEGESSLHALSVVGRQRQRERRHDPLVLKHRDTVIH